MGRVGELDGVRGLAILLVVVGHAGGVGLDGGGPVGVTLFFILSGYLITGLLTRELDRTGRVDLRAFWARRARRILPALVLPVTLAASCAAVWVGTAYALRIVMALPVANYATALGFDLGPLVHTWSLAVEEQFYLAWPVVMLAAWRTRSAASVIGAAFVVALAWRIVASGVNGAWAYNSLDCNAYALLAGAGIAISGWRLRPWAGPVAVAVLTAASLTVLKSHPATQLVALAAGVALVAGARGVDWLAWRPLRYVGTVSYGWYLWHYVLMWPLGGPARWVAAVLSLAIAAASWRWLERPILHARRSLVRAPEPHMTT